MIIFGFDSVTGQNGIVGLEQRIGREPLSLGQSVETLLRREDNVMQNADF